MREVANVFVALQECGLVLQPILCGGSKRTVQDREQWASGCNFAAIRPGLVLSYARNDVTLAEMEKAGFTVMSAADFLTGERTIEEDHRAVIAFPGGELARGGGGPRCMTLPIERDDPWN